jgi:hypothetical protein
VKIINDLTPFSTVKHLSSIDVLALRLWLPDVEGQSVLANFIDRETARIDQLIEKKQRMVALLGEKQAGQIGLILSALEQGYSKASSKMVNPHSIRRLYSKYRDGEGAVRIHDDSRYRR